MRRRQEQPKLLRVLAGVQVDDVLVVPRMGTLGRSMAEVVRASNTSQKPVRAFAASRKASTPQRKPDGRRWK